jgi:hypothetical protein
MSNFALHHPLAICVRLSADTDYDFIAAGQTQLQRPALAGNARARASRCSTRRAKALGGMSIDCLAKSEE